jgi:hypothetical protein
MHNAHDYNLVQHTFTANYGGHRMTAHYCTLPHRCDPAWSHKCFTRSVTRMAAVHVKNMSEALALDLWLTTWNLHGIFRGVINVPPHPSFRCLRPLCIDVLYYACVTVNSRHAENCMPRVTHISLRVHATWHDTSKAPSLSEHQKSSERIYPPHYNSI